jgi:hypothetical protein
LATIEGIALCEPGCQSGALNRSLSAASVKLTLLLGTCNGETLSKGAGLAGAGGFIGKTHAGTCDRLNSSFEGSVELARVLGRHASNVKTAINRTKLQGASPFGGGKFATDPFISFFMHTKS